MPHISVWRGFLALDSSLLSQICDPVRMVNHGEGATGCGIGTVGSIFNPGQSTPQTHDAHVTENVDRDVVSCTKDIIGTASPQLPFVEIYKKSKLKMTKT